MGFFLEQFGWPRMAGRVLGWLLLSEEDEVSLDELAAQLGVSKASVSNAARQLEQIGALERAPRCGTRKAYYRLAGDIWERMLELEKKVSDGFVGFAAESRRELERHPGRDARLSEMEQIFSRYGEMLAGFIASWRKERERG